MARDLELLDEHIEGKVRRLRYTGGEHVRVPAVLLPYAHSGRRYRRRAPHLSSHGTRAPMQVTLSVSQFCRQVFQFGTWMDPRFHTTFL